jgi:hypothetical protein
MKEKIRDRNFRLQACGFYPGVDILPQPIPPEDVEVIGEVWNYERSR